MEIVGRDPLLCFSGTEYAIQKIDRLLSDPSLQCSLQALVQTRRDIFGTERFKSEFLRTARCALKCASVSKNVG